MGECVEISVPGTMRALRVAMQGMRRDRVSKAELDGERFWIAVVSLSLYDRLLMRRLEKLDVLDRRYVDFHGFRVYRAVDMGLGGG